ncbi:MAG: SDR family oxidoreductase [Acidobacteriota bacterium]|nr:SDR family oxidoreductase [Acidobacteriota bacterium]
MIFNGKNIVVTGGANGIGLAISRNIAAAGGSVWIFDLESENPSKAAHSIGCQACIADITDRQSLESAFDAAGIPDVVVANAGIAQPASLLNTTADLWNRTLAVNLSGAFHTVQIAAQRMKHARRGSIVLTASTNSFDGEADLAAYNASKAGLLGILHTAANELGPYGIRINAVCPGLIRTRLTASSFSDTKVISEYFKHIALGRGGEPEEVAQAVMFLASDWASYITGTTLIVDGGQMAAKFGTWGKETDSFDGQRWTRGA